MGAGSSSSRLMESGGAVEDYNRDSDGVSNCVYFMKSSAKLH